MASAADSHPLPPEVQRWCMSGPGLVELFELQCDRFDGRPRGSDGHDEVVDVVVRRCHHAGAVDLQEDGGGEPAEALVAVDERVVATIDCNKAAAFNQTVG